MSRDVVIEECRYRLVPVLGNDDGNGDDAITVKMLMAAVRLYGLRIFSSGGRRLENCNKNLPAQSRLGGGNGALLIWNGMTTVFTPQPASSGPERKKTVRFGRSEKRFALNTPLSLVQFLRKLQLSKLKKIRKSRFQTIPNFEDVF